MTLALSHFNSSEGITNCISNKMSAFAKSGGFNHLFATAHKRQFCYESLAVADGSQIRSDGGTSIAASSRFFAYPAKTGGGSTVAVLPLDSYGRRHVPVQATTYQQPLYKMHVNKVHCVSFSPHDQEKTNLASGSSGGDVHIYQVPEEGLIEDYTGSSDQSTTTAINTASAVHGLVWHPSAANIIAVRHPKSIEVLDLIKQEAVWNDGNKHLQDVHSCAWSWDGKQAVTTSKDTIIRLFDSRTGEISNSVQGHGSWRPSISCWAGRESFFYTTGVGKDRSREIKLWDIRSLKDGAIASHRIDSGSSVLIPQVDTDTGLLYVTSRGDTGFRILEMTSSNKIKELTNCRLSGDPVLDFCLLPKSSLDVKGCEMARVLRLTQNSVDPVRVELPRKDKSKIDTSIYIDTISRVATMDSAAFCAATTGTDITAPTLISVEKAVASVSKGGKVKKMTETNTAKSTTAGTTAGTTAATGTTGDASASTKGETKSGTTNAEDQAAERRRKKVTTAFGGQSKYKYIQTIDNGRNVDKTWYNLKIDTSDTNSMLIAATSNHFAVPWQSGGGGPIYIGQVSKPGKALSGNSVKTLSGHKDRVNVLAFNPHDSLVLASGSDDADIKLWRIEQENVGGECINTLSSHIRSIRALLWNPNCNNVLASSSSDDTVKLWDATSSNGAAVTIEVGEAPLSMCYNYKGDGLAIAGRKKVIFVDPRKGGESHTTINDTHAGSKGQRIVWLRDPNYLFTVGTTKQAAREFKIWDIRNSTKALCAITIDRGAGMLNPFYDEDTNVMYVKSDAGAM